MKKEKLTQVQRIARLEKVSSLNYFDLIPIKKFMKKMEEMIAQDGVQGDEEE
jgi:hypothetical protein